MLQHVYTRCNRPNRDAVIAMCTAMMCKLQRPEISTAQKTISLIIYAQITLLKLATVCLIYVYKSRLTTGVFWLHKPGLTMSYMSTIRLLEKLGENHDATVYKWRPHCDLIGHVHIPDI